MRFIGFGGLSLDVELSAYIAARDLQNFFPRKRIPMAAETRLQTLDPSAPPPRETRDAA